MAILEEVNDQDIEIGVGDTRNGSMGGTDVRDLVLLGTLKAGESYTVSIDLSSTAVLTEFGVLNAYAQGTRYFVGNGVLFPASVQDAGFATFTPGELVGNTLTFTIDVKQDTYVGIELNVHGGASVDYSVAFANSDPYGVTDGDDVVEGTEGADDVLLLRGDDLINANGGDDTVNGNNGQDTINGGDGNDSLNGGSQADVLDGGTGDDTVIGGSGDDLVGGGDGSDAVFGSNGNDTLDGGTGDDRLDGGKDDDVIDGGAGNDTLLGSFGDDTMTGGADADLFKILPNSGADVITDFTTGLDTIDLSKLGVSAFGSLAMADTGNGVVIDFGGGNSLTLNGLTVADLSAGDFVLAPDATAGSAGDDQITGTEAPDTLSGQDGDDRVTGKAGDDLVSGGAGRDYLDGDAGNDTLDGGDGNDKLIGDGGADVLNGGNNNDRLYGGDDNDTLDGGNGNDLLVGGSGDDVLIGGRGKDRMEGGTGADTFVFANNAGRDVIKDFGNGIDTLDFSGVSGVTAFFDLGLEQSGLDVVITYGGNNTVTLENTLLIDLDVADFVF